MYYARTRVTSWPQSERAPREGGLKRDSLRAEWQEVEQGRLLQNAQKATGWNAVCLSLRATRKGG